ncbi:hypothetical protein ACJX0J_031170, partial [Zea mays]
RQEATLEDKYMDDLDLLSFVAIWKLKTIIKSSIVPQYKGQVYNAFVKVPDFDGPGGLAICAFTSLLNGIDTFALDLHTFFLQSIGAAALFWVDLVFVIIKILFAQMNAFYRNYMSHLLIVLDVSISGVVFLQISLFIFFEFSPHGWGQNESNKAAVILFLFHMIITLEGGGTAPLMLSFHFVQDALTFVGF